LPEARCNSTSVQPAATRTASRAAADNGAAEIGVYEHARRVDHRREGGGGRRQRAAAVSATLAGLMTPERASCWARAPAALTSFAPSCSRAATRRGSANTTSVLGT
jgi:hypothetical protein